MKIFHILLDYMTDVKQKNDHLVYMLEIAVMRGDEETARLALEQWTDLKTRGQHIVSVLGKAADTKFLQILLEQDLPAETKDCCLARALTTAASETLSLRSAFCCKLVLIPTCYCLELLQPWFTRPNVGKKM